jgi:uncharacterized protein (TIGR04255 family)
MYKNAPLTEAVCEVRFSADSQWDLAMPGLLYEQLRNDFPIRKPMHLLQAQIGQTAQGLQQALRAIEFLEFSNDSASSLVRVGPNILSIHNHGVYPGWTKFCPLIEGTLQTYVKVAAPKEIERIGLRFVNKIHVPSEVIDLEEYFNFFPHIGKDLPQVLGPYMMGVEFPYDEGATVLRLELAAEATENPKTNASRLDLDYFSSRPGSVTLSNVGQWLKTAHERIEDAFEACVTEKLRALFDEANNG